MAKVTVRKCMFSGLLFESDAAYLKHLNKLRDEQRFKRERARRRANLDEFVATLHNAASLQEIEDWLNANIHDIVDFHSDIVEYGVPRRRKPRRPEDTITIKLTGMKWKECQTTHCAPKGQTTTGWARDTPHVPEWGWNGRVTITFGGRGYDYFNTDYLKFLRVHTGSGGGGSQEQAFSVTIFAKDFEVLGKKKLRHEAIKKLSDGNILLPV